MRGDPSPGTPHSLWASPTAPASLPRVQVICTLSSPWCSHRGHSLPHLRSGSGNLLKIRNQKEAEQDWISDLSLSHSAYTFKIYANNHNLVSRAADMGRGWRNSLAPSRSDFSSRPQCYQGYALVSLGKCFKCPLILAPDCPTADSKFFHGLSFTKQYAKCIH